MAMRVLALFAQLVAVHGVCHDIDGQCYAWMLDGQCQSNPEHMYKTCPLSCRICEHNCTDATPDCTSWAKQNDCNTNAEYMLRNCPTACGLCTPRCEDTHGGLEGRLDAEKAGPGELTMCEKWARQGECQGNPDFVLKHCPVACGVCKPKCKDLHESCHAWAADGECKNNTGFMLKHCPYTCGQCVKEPLHSHDVEPADQDSPGGCHNVADKDEDCSKWAAAGECHTNPIFMMSHCAASCGLCTPVCTDHSPQCPAWAQKGECDENKNFMLTTCPGSCGVCSELQKHLAHAKMEL